MLSITMISDTHSSHEEIRGLPDSGDILIHAGDTCGVSREREIIRFNEWLGTLNFKHKIVVPGNHDKLFETDANFAKSLMTNAIVLIDDLVEIEGIKIYGSPWTPQFGHWSFMKAQKHMHKVWNKIPNHIDILVTHGPPHGILDEVIEEYFDNSKKKVNAGCPVLLNKVKEIKPKYHVFGHIHEGYGVLETPDTVFVNAASLDETYKPVNGAITLMAFDKPKSE